MARRVRLEWDMYVDLPANTVRYCFHTLADASTFTQRFRHVAEGRAVAEAAQFKGWVFEWRTAASAAPAGS
jgi:hypothetical protein